MSKPDPKIQALHDLAKTYLRKPEERARRIVDDAGDPGAMGHVVHLTPTQRAWAIGEMREWIIDELELPAWLDCSVDTRGMAEAYIDAEIADRARAERVAARIAQI